jgi:2-(1,2-epoxy-1,2-dihydrophenyl)acetyl-CoA isomerase
MIDKGPVLLDIADGIARLRLNRPDAANGMSVELLSALCDAIMACHGASDLRVVLLSGEGTNFCAGGDVRPRARSCRTIFARRRPICRMR